MMMMMMMMIPKDRRSHVMYKITILSYLMRKHSLVINIHMCQCSALGMLGLSFWFHVLSEISSEIGERAEVLE